MSCLNCSLFRIYWIEGYLIYIGCVLWHIGYLTQNPAYIYIYIYIYTICKLYLYHTSSVASGWVIRDVSFGFMGGFGSCNIRPPHPNDPIGIDLTPTPIPAANLRIHTTKKEMTTEMALYIILQQPISAKLFF